MTFILKTCISKRAYQGAGEALPNPKAKISNNTCLKSIYYPKQRFTNNTNLSAPSKSLFNLREYLWYWYIYQGSRGLKFCAAKKGAFTNILTSVAANLALTAGILIHIIGYLVIYGVVTDTAYAAMSGGVKVILAMLYPNIGLAWAIKVLQYYENSGTGCQWSNLFTTSQPGDPITMGVVWILFFVNMGIYGTITWYIDSVHPGPYGVSKKWYFCFQVWQVLAKPLSFFLKSF